MKKKQNKEVKTTTIIVMTTDFIIYVCSVLSALALGANLGFSSGIKKGIEISMETAITETVKRLYDEFKVLGKGEQFKNIVNKVFDINRLNLWEDE